jgi:transposase
VRLIPPAYVKEFVRRQKNDAADASAIARAARDPEMRFVPVRSVERQSLLMLHSVRDGLVAQRTQTMNMLRGHIDTEREVLPVSSRHEFLPDRRNLPSHRAPVGSREILPAGEPIHHIAHQLTLAHRHAVIVHAPGDGASEGVPIVLGRRARPGWALRRA